MTRLRAHTPVRTAVPRAPDRALDRATPRNRSESPPVANGQNDAPAINPLVFIPVVGWLILALQAIFSGAGNASTAAGPSAAPAPAPETEPPGDVALAPLAFRAERPTLRTEPLAALDEPRGLFRGRAQRRSAIQLEVPFRRQRSARDCDDTIRWMANATFGRRDTSYWLFGGHASDLRMATSEPRSGQIEGRSDRLDLARRRIGFRQGREVIDALLERGMPAYVGVARRGGANLNADGITDHWVLITGRTADGRYLYHDPDRGPGFMFQVADSGMLFNTDPRTVGGAGYQVSVVRPPWRIPPGLQASFDNIPASSAPGQILSAIQTAGAILGRTVG